MDFINVTGEVMASCLLAILILFLIWTWITIEHAFKAWVWGAVIAGLALVSIVIVPAIGSKTYSVAEYYEPKQIETIYHENGDVEQFAYKNNGERVNIGEVYEITFHEDTMYREYVINRSWLFWNFENLIIDYNQGRIFEFSANESFDK